jgi:glycosyltransferase involved in cell wall biosynthesis
MLVKDLIERKSRWAKRAWISTVERRNLTYAAAIHVTSETERIELQRFGFRLPEIFEVPNGVSLRSTESGAGDLPPEAEGVLGRDGPVVLYLGRINWKKGLDRLIPAMAALPEATLLIVGNDEENHSAQLAAQAEREGVANRVVFCGPVYGPAKFDLLRRATVLALPSYSENFGTVVLEAMSQGCPVVVTPEVGSASVVREVCGGLVVPGDPAALGPALARVIRDTDFRSVCGRNGQAAMRSRYSWDSTAGKMLEMYRTVVQSHRKAAR